MLKSVNNKKTSRKPLKVNYEFVGESSERLNQAFDILFEETLKGVNEEEILQHELVNPPS